MFKLYLNARECISCAICMDVCPPQALHMRTWKGQTVEGSLFCYLGLDPEAPVADWMTFPYLWAPERCDGCMNCVNQCPVVALQVTRVEAIQLI